MSWIDKLKPGDKFRSKDRQWTYEFLRWTDLHTVDVKVVGGLQVGLVLVCTRFDLYDWCEPMPSPWAQKLAAGGFTVVEG